MSSGYDLPSMQHPHPTPALRTSLIVAAFLLGACAARAPTMPDEALAAPLRMPTVAAIRDLLAKERYRELETLLERYRLAAAKDTVEWETPLVRAYAAFDAPDSKLLAQVDGWLEYNSRSYQAHAARAYCLLALGHDARGSGWAEDTKPEQFALMQRFLASARKAVTQSIKLQKDNLAIHLLNVRLAKFEGREPFFVVADQAMDAHPASHSIRVATISGLQPRWYGDEDDYSRIDAFVRLSQREKALNPRFKNLLGYTAWARGNDLASNKKKNYEEAIDQYTAALGAGEEPEFLDGRFRAAAAARRYDLAIRDARRLEEIEPWRKDDPEERPLETVLGSARYWAAAKFKEGHSDEGIAVLGMILTQVPDDARALLVRGSAQCRARRFEHGTKDLRRAIVIDPDLMPARHALVGCLVLGGKPIEAIQVQEQYVIKAPGNGEARNLLAGLYASADDVESTSIAFDIACKAGYADACSRVQQLAGGNPDAARLPTDWVAHPQERIAAVAEYEEFIKGLAAPGRFAVPEGAGRPRILSRPAAAFPKWAARYAREGWVEVQIYFNADGSVAGAAPVRARPSGYFELAAVTATLRWRSEPTPGGWVTKERIELKAAAGKGQAAKEKTI